MKNIKFLSVLLILFSFTSCEDYFPPNTTVYGTITNQHTGLLLSDVTIELWGGTNINSASKHKYKIIRTVYTGSDGYFEIQFHKGNITYWLQYKFGNYIPTDYNLNGGRSQYRIENTGKQDFSKLMH
jgi:hypothetical protein